MEKFWNVISLGAGVQSTCLVLMAKHGEFDVMPDAAVFADTGDEPKSVYDWLAYLESLDMPFPIYRVRRRMRDGSEPSLSGESLRMRTSKHGVRYSQTNIPFFTLSESGERGMVGHRSCTSDFKIRPILKFLRRHCGIKRGQSHVTVRQWIGISLDELKRMKASRDPWCETHYPLIERRMTRQNCLDWIQSYGYPEPPRSACVFCPFHHDVEWRRLQRDEPEEFARAVQFEKDIQAAKMNSDNFSSMPYLHSSRKPLSEVDFRNDFERGQLSLWDDECEGMCGV